MAEYADRLTEGNNALLAEDGNGLLNAAEGTPFPIPKNGLEVIWNHLVRWRGNHVDRTGVFAPVTRSGGYNLGKVHTETRFQYNLPGITVEKMDNVILFVKQTVLGPSLIAGRIVLVHNTLNQSVGPYLGGCPRIGFFSQIKAFFDNKHRYTLSIPSIIFIK